LSWTFFSNGFRGGTHGWINEREMGGGWIGAYASHLIDFTRWLFESEVASCGGIARIEDPTRADRDGLPRTATAENAYSAWLMGSSGSIELVADQKLIVRRANHPGPWFGRVQQALHAGVQIAPSFDDGLAVAEAMDQLRANAIHVGLPDEIRPS
jgi:predicted dehydrogenase